MRKNRFLSLLLALVMLLGIVSALGGAASAADAPQAWWDGLYIKWELVPGKTVYNIVGYYSVPGVIAQQRAFDDIVFVDENRVYCQSAENYAGIISTEDGIVTFRATNSFANYFNVISNSPQLKLWFTLSAGTGESAGILTSYTIQTDVFTSETVTGEQLHRGYVSPLPSIGTITGSIGISGASNPKAGDVLTATLSGGVANLSSAIVKYQWQRSDDGGNSFSDLWISASQPANSKSYTIRDYDVGKKIRVKVTADRYDGVLYSNVLTITPSLTGSVSIDPLTPKTGDTLTAYYEGITSIPSSAIHYQWYAAGADGRFNAVSGATGRTYKVPSSAKAGDLYRVTVTADGYAGSITSSNIAEVARGSALTGTVTLTPANPKLGEKLTATLSGMLASIPASKINYYWQVSDEPSSGIFTGLSSVTGNMYTIPSGDAFLGWGVRVKVSADGYDGEIISNVVIAGSGSTYPKGDVDRSGQVGNSDLIMVARHVVHIITLTGEQFTLGDMDNDNVIDNKDIISVARKVVGL